MGKKGMSRPGASEPEIKEKNDFPPVQEIKGKAKTGNDKAGRIN